MVSDELKREYAARLVEEPDVFKAALIMFPDQENIHKALWIAGNWPYQPDVLAMVAEIKAEINKWVKPTKDDLLERVWHLTGVGMLDDRLKAAKLYAELENFIPKPVPVVVNNNTTLIQPKAIKYKDHGTDEEWEIAAEAQQRELLNVATSRH